MKKIKFAVSVLIVLGIVASLVGSIIASADTNSATTYLEGKTASSWSVMARAAAGKHPSADFLKTTSGSKAIDLEAPIIAIAAAGHDPRTFASTDLVATLKGFYDGTQLGDANILNDDIFGLLALSSAGIAQGDSVIEGTKNFVLTHQNTDGGWSYATSGTSDTNTTAAALMALYAVGVPASDAHLQNGISYMHSAQNADGGFPYDPTASFGTDSDASSDAWVIMALNRLGVNAASWTKNGKSPLDNLASLQTASGFYAYQAGSAEDSFSPVTTSYALIAALGKWFPVSVYSGSVNNPTVHVTYRIEGKSAELCSGEADAVNAIDVLAAAETTCGITHTVKSMSFGEYVDTIGGEAGVGQNGWLYLVNAVQPSVGADAYPLKGGDDVVWYWGDYQWKPMRVTLPSSQIASAAAGSVKVEYYDSAAWVPLSGAVLKNGSSSFVSDGNGMVSLVLPDGAYRVFAEKDGFIRSNWSRIVFGSGQNATLGLSVTLGTGGGSGGSGDANSSVGFSVSPKDGASSVDFGILNSGVAAQKTIALRNKGASAISLSADITGDTVFKNFLSLDGRAWKLFSARLGSGEAKDASVSLSIPASFASTGTKSGVLIFWATPSGN